MNGQVQPGPNRSRENSSPNLEANATSSVGTIQTPRSRNEGFEQTGANPVPVSVPGLVELNIDQLLLEGFPSHQRHRIAHAMESELVRLLNEDGIPASLQRNSHIQNLSLVDTRLSADERPETIGLRVAQSLFREMTR